MDWSSSSVTPYLPVATELASHPDVLEVSVVGREHPTWGERPMAYVILHTESARRWAGKHAEFSSVLKAHARQRLPGFATPEWVVIVEELPVCPFRYARRHDILKRAPLENVNRKDHEDGFAQTSCFCEVVDIAAYGLV
jgi:acyl-CoA synthetase (AMP-forming)/AMP-acid ligase II